MKKIVSSMLDELTGQPAEVSVPENPVHGDYTTNVALKNPEPRKFAEDLKNKIIEYQKTSGAGIIERVDIAGPGFINLFLSEASLSSQIAEVLKKRDTYGFAPKYAEMTAVSREIGRSEATKTDEYLQKNTHGKTGEADNAKMDNKSPKISRRNAAVDYSARQNGKSSTGEQGNFFPARRIMVEFADPNPFKEFHIGHLRNIALGESYCRLLESQGNLVRRVNYEGDVGMHVAKALYGLLHGQSHEKAYAAGAKAFDEHLEAKNEIGELNKKLYAGDAGLRDIYQKGKKWSLDQFEGIYTRLGTRFDRYYFESEVAPLGMKIVLDHPDVFEKSEGAWVFRGHHTRVFVTKEHYATYEAKDLALAPLKYSEWPYDLSIIMTGSEQSEYFKVMLAALAKINPDLAAKTRHIPFGMVRLTTGKMSSRTGDVITADWLIEEAKKKIHGILSKNTSNYSESEQNDITEKAAVAAIKYSMLRVTASSDISFDLVASVSFEGDSGPYLQYTYARCKSVLRKADSRLRGNDKMNAEERILARQIIQFPDVVADAAANFAPNTVCTYLFHLAQQFNLFYAKHEILGNSSRLTLTDASAQILKNGLFLLGIDVLEKM